ncbi:hypothetical protein PR202_gb00011 [Eleusine coracana subsp. coracana]|uniref:C3H1-type domain-containing protein n=1 Tax=Eleusine coracana subsp. coracana TaxID=191504 RepID=A0AAV5DQJ8_ELECO|nr:hypothetical protein PR202_gb00011 [Eleusine coracana subsp. coracana]
MGSSSPDDQQLRPGTTQYYAGSHQSETTGMGDGMFPSYQGGSVPVELYAVQGENGEPVCTFYSRYGICKFGPNCKFDHPMGTHMYGTATSPTSDAPTMCYQLAPSPGHSERLLEGGSGPGTSHRISQSSSQQIPSGNGSTKGEAS